ncbi:MAG: peptidylprolyl isomerase [Chroococcidiopsis sp.]
MAQAFQIGNRTISPDEIVFLLANYQMLPQLWRELTIDAAIASIELTSSEQTHALEQFNLKHQLSTPAERQAWGMRYGMTNEQLNALAIRELKIEKFKITTWEHCLESHFLTHKSKLDRVIYSLLRTDNAEVASELYFRIKAKEQSFAELAREYSLGPEAQTGGLLGPVQLSQPHPVLVKMLISAQPGQLYSPTRLGEWFVILRLEKFIPAQLDESMRQQLLNSLFEAWIQEQLHQISAAWLQDTPTLVAV